MNSKVAKLLRRKVYKEHHGHHRRRVPLYMRDPDTGTVYATGQRRMYKDLKKALTENRNAYIEGVWKDGKRHQK